MSSIGHSDVKKHHVKQAIASLDQNPPVLETWYTVVNLVDDAVEVLYFAMRHLDDDASVKEMEMRLTIDGVVYTGSMTAAKSNEPANNTWQYIYLDGTPDADGYYLKGSTTVRNSAYYTSLRGRSVKFEVRHITDAIGANAELDGRCQYLVYREEGGGVPLLWFEHRMATLTQTPVINTYYDVLNGSKNCRLLYF